MLDKKVYASGGLYSRVSSLFLSRKYTITRTHLAQKRLTTRETRYIYELYENE